ncbi:hypothetical protein ACFVZE_15630 [Streptomyces anulatus]|uniref:hypothetical protein n=1 Tax=Streptomyces anulatus TaxID=1892 RepID=UPI0036509C98
MAVQSFAVRRHCTPDVPREQPKAHCVELVLAAMTGARERRAEASPWNFPSTRTRSARTRKWSPSRYGGCRA